MKTMVTLCFSPPQAILGGEKRYDDHQNQVLAAALRHPLNLVDSAVARAGVVAAGFPALELVPGGRAGRRDRCRKRSPWSERLSPSNLSFGAQDKVSCGFSSIHKHCIIIYTVG
jgi:hypothetical protein